MAITYNKNKITKDRQVTPSGPRDRQRKQQIQQMVVSDQTGIVEELRNQVHYLQDKLASVQVSGGGGWTDDKVNAEIIKAVKEETSRLKETHKAEANELSLRANHYFRLTNELETKIKLLEKDIEVLKEKVLEKDKIIEELKNRPDTDNNVTTLLAEATKKIEALATSGNFTPADNPSATTSDRPQMETVFVDPIEKEAEVESHFDVEDISVSEKNALEEKKNKLKSLLGKLPSKR